MTEGGKATRDPLLGVERHGENVVVRLTGELDLYNAATVREALLAECEAGPARLVVDLSEVEFVDSTALGVLVEVRRRLGERGTVSLCGAGDEARRALEISGLDHHFAVHATVDDALAD